MASLNESQSQTARYHLLQSDPHDGPSVPPKYYTTRVISSNSPFTPECVGGVCCPVGTIVNHEHPKSNFRKVLLISEITLHIMLIIVQFGNWYLRAEFLAEHHKEMFPNGDKGDMDEDAFDKVMEELEKYEYLNSWQKTVFFTVGSVWFLWNVFTRVVFFMLYSARTVLDAETGNYIVYKPSLISKLFFPLATVYYHEGNMILNVKFILSYLFGCVYTVLCYKPTYEKSITEEAIPIARVNVFEV